MLNLVIHPSDILRRPAKTVANPHDISIQKLIPAMIETMIAENGIGLAAPQINQSVRVIIITHNNTAIPMINPEITRKSFFKEWGEEGCLSIPGVFGQVRRHRTVTVQYLDRRGQPRSLKVSGMTARIIQHEIDHLNGILFIDLARDLIQA